LVSRGNVLLTVSGFSATRTSELQGPVKFLTPRYCSPEEAEGEPRDSSVDIWSLGCVFLEMAAALIGLESSDLLDHYQRFGTGVTSYHNNITATQNLLQTWSAWREPQRALPVWIGKMLQVNRHERPTAAELLEMILEQPGDHPRYCGDCCGKANSPEADSESGTLSISQGSPPRSKRVRRACFECKKRKVRCDETKPDCHNCLRHGTECPGYPPDLGLPPSLRTPPIPTSHTPDPSSMKRRLSETLDTQSSNSTGPDHSLERAIVASPPLPSAHSDQSDDDLPPAHVSGSETDEWSSKVHPIPVYAPSTNHRLEQEADQQPFMTQSKLGGDIMFCHECHDEWYRDEQGITCPKCHSDYTEIIELEDENDPHDTASHDYDQDDNDADPMPNLEQQPSTMPSSGRHEMMFCHECEHEWRRDQHGFTCPKCHSEFTEIIEDVHVPRDNILRGSEQDHGDADLMPNLKGKAPQTRPLHDQPMEGRRPALKGDFPSGANKTAAFSYAEAAKGLSIGPSFPPSQDSKHSGSVFTEAEQTIAHENWKRRRSEKPDVYRQGLFDIIEDGDNETESPMLDNIVPSFPK
jgi:Zn finger protein HypA/HybF involved in hydrogenase expression